MVPGGVVDGTRQARGLGTVAVAGVELRYETAWLMTHKLRHPLNERPELALERQGIKLKANNLGPGRVAEGTNFAYGSIPLINSLL